MDKDKLMKAGAIVAQVRDEVAAMIKPDISFIELMDFSEKRIVELGGEVAWAQISPNEIAAHYCPTDSDNPVCTENDLISIDLGVHIDGNIADTAITIDLSGKYQYLIDISKEALEETIKIAVPGTKLCELGKKQEEIAKKHGVSIIT
ncbi:MAG: M24 family metallopeptidase, partial [Candidatus Woesearchaeota archaeon]